MALLLVMAVNHTHLDPVKDLRGCYKRGDIVDIYEDSQHDGDIVANPIAAPFVLIRVSGVTREQALKYLQSERQGAVEVRRRLYRLRVDDLPANVRNALNRDRYFSTTRAAVINFIRNKVTNVDET